MKVPKSGRPFKVMINPDVIAALNMEVQALQAERNNYQIGVGTVVAEMAEVLAHNPKLLHAVMQAIRKAHEETELKNA